MQKFFAVCLCLIFVGSSYAREWPVPRGESREPNPYTYDPKILEKIPKEFLNDAPAAYIHAATFYRVEEDNTVETTSHEVVRINSRKALDSLGEHRSIVYAPAYEKVTLHIARVHKPDGKIIEVEPKHIQLRDTGTDFLVYDTDKQVIISLPSVDVNDVIEVKWTTRGKHPEYGDYFFQRYFFGDERYPIVSDYLALLISEKKKVTHAPINPSKGNKDLFTPKVTNGKEGVLYEWKAANRGQITQYEKSPSRELNRPGIALTTMTDWKQVGDWKKKTRANCWDCTADLKTLVAETTKGLKTETEKAAALATWVKKNIRYISAGEKHDYIPHPPALIVKNRFGDCKDTSQLLAVLLKEAGISCSLVTLGVKGDGQVMEEVPSPWGTHAILLVKADDKEHWVDTTVNLAAWNLLPEADRDRKCYVLSDTGLALRRTPKLTADEFQIIQNTTVDLDHSGTSKNVRTMKYSGLGAYDRRDEWYGVPSGERRRSYTSELQDANPRCKLLSLEIDEKMLEDINIPVEAKAVYEIFSHVSGTPLEGSVTDSPVWGRLLSVSVDMDRPTPIDLIYPFVSEHTYKIQLPPGRRFTQKIESVTHKSVWGTFVREVIQNDRTMTITMKTRVEQTLVDPKDFEAFRIWQDEVSNGYRVYFGVRSLNAEDGPDAHKEDIQALQNLLKKNPKDRKAAMELVTLLMDNDRPADAAKVIDDTLKIYPKNFELLKLGAESSREPKRVVYFYNELIKQKPDDFDLRYDYCYGLLEYRQTENIKTILDPIFKSADDIAKAAGYVILARAALVDDKTDDAKKALENAKKANENIIEEMDYNRTLGQTYKAEKKYEEAARAFTKAIDKDRPSAGWKEVVLAWVQSKQTEQALAALTHWIPYLEDPSDFFIAAEMYEKLGRLAEAKHLTKQLEGPAGQKQFHRYEALHAISEKRYADASTAFAKIPYTDLSEQDRVNYIHTLIKLADYKQIADLAAKQKLGKTEETITRNLLARLKSIEGDFEKSPEALASYTSAEYLILNKIDVQQGETLLKQVSERLPKNGHLLALQAWLNVEQGKLRQALPNCEAAVKALPKNYFGYLVRGRIQFERGEAFDDLSKAVELSESKDALSLYWLANAYHETGKAIEAKNAIQKAITLAPKDKEIQALERMINGTK